MPACLVGPVQVPAVLQPLAAQIQPHHRAAIAGSTCDTCGAAHHHSAAGGRPLQHLQVPTSNYLGAALVGAALVASPTVYADYVRDGQTGLIADADGWGRRYRALTQDRTSRGTDRPPATTCGAGSYANEPTEQMRAVLDAVAPSWRVDDAPASSTCTSTRVLQGARSSRRPRPPRRRRSLVFVMTGITGTATGPGEFHRYGRSLPVVALGRSAPLAGPGPASPTWIGCATSDPDQARSVVHFRDPGARRRRDGGATQQAGIPVRHVHDA